MNNKEFKIHNSKLNIILIDNKDIYHIGASLKDAGKKVFAFTKIDIDIMDILTDDR